MKVNRGKTSRWESTALLSGYSGAFQNNLPHLAHSPPPDISILYLFLTELTFQRNKFRPGSALDFQRLTERRIFMRHSLGSVIAAGVLFALPISCLAASANFQGRTEKPQNVQVGPRPYYLVEDMDPSPLKRTLQQCS